MAISLDKGASISLKKADGSGLSVVRLGLGWDESSAQQKRGLFGRLKASGDIDLDASAIMFDSSKSVREIVYYGELKSLDGSVRHSGDNLTGAGEGDDEQIVIDLMKVDSAVTDIVFTINSYSGETFDQLSNVFARVVDLSGSGEVEVVRYDLAESAGRTGNVIAKLSREGAGWKFVAIGEFADGRTASKVVDVARRLL